MLIQFTVENFLSFEDETTFSMVAASDDQQHSNHLVADVAGKGRALLRAAAIYGANAAGKSNLFKAIKFAKDLIVQGTRSGQSIPITSFRLGSGQKKSSKFEFIFNHLGTVYSYGFKADTSHIIEEWLYATPNKHEITLFERIASDDRKIKVEFGSTLKGRSKKQEQFLEFVAKGTRPNQLLLTEAVDRNVDAVKPVMDWFSNVLLVISAEAQANGLEMNIQKDTHFTDFLGTFLQNAGTGIEGIKTEETPLDFDRHFPDMTGNIRDEIAKLMNNHKEDEEVMISIQSDKRYLISSGSTGPPALLELIIKHRTANGGLVDFTLDEESEGTQRLIHLFPAIFAMKANKEKVILLDELDRRLHPHLARFYVEAALACNENNRHNQLIFTTHDTNLLDLELLRRDEIWFVEKDQQGTSKLYSLAEFKIRPDLKVEKGYLNGRFGAIPFLGDICNLGWTSHEPETLVEA